MPNREDILRTKTHKDDGVDLAVRVYYTLIDDAGLQAHRTSKFVALLVNHLHQQGTLSGQTIDDILLECVD